MLDSSFFHNSTNSLPAEICFFPLHDCTCARAWKNKKTVGMPVETGPEQNIITSPQNDTFLIQKKRRKIENARLNLLFVPTLNDGNFNKTIPNTVVLIHIAL